MSLVEYSGKKGSMLRKITKLDLKNFAIPTPHSPTIIFSDKLEVGFIVLRMWLCMKDSLNEDAKGIKD
ncbi:hypothetical protein HPP92_010051 [Vanilla planifolia]|uniref:Uncharacterized protein n=1 Tax=Vanilla planifolia TaxID=51239 RepID=A0A835RGZ8_VANPL|nr:hypothetical protein HPP92_010051 [Vanilla planifolia]